jgi:hypothetical protein
MVQGYKKKKRSPYYAQGRHEREGVDETASLFEYFIRQELELHTTIFAYHQLTIGENLVKKIASVVIGHEGKVYLDEVGVETTIAGLGGSRMKGCRCWPFILRC